jgi:hypothetical protein
MIEISRALDRVCLVSRIMRIAATGIYHSLRSGRCDLLVVHKLIQANRAMQPGLLQVYFCGRDGKSGSLLLGSPHNHTWKRTTHRSLSRGRLTAEHRMTHTVVWITEHDESQVLWDQAERRWSSCEVLSWANTMGLHTINSTECLHTINWTER